MPKAYLVVAFQEIRDPAKVEVYRNLAGPALLAEGASFLARGMPDRVYENGQMERVVIMEFPSLEKAIAAHDSPGYQAALMVLGDGAKRDVRIVEGV